MNLENVLEVKNLKKEFIYERNILGKVKGKIVAVDSVSFELKKGETLAIVGESGSGKSTLANLIMNLLKKSSGEIILEGKNLDELSKGEIKKIRPYIQMIFQDPYSSLDPSMTVTNSL